VPERYDTGALTACASIRLMQPLDHPAIGGGFEIILATDETIFDYDADVILTQRYAMQNPPAVDRLAAHARKTGAKLLYDLDDDLLNLPRTHPDAAVLNPFRPVVRRMLAVADAVWVSTPGLAESIAPTRPDAVVVENRLDERIWVHQPASRPLWDDPVRILCMGTTSHTDDFAIIAPALVRLKAEYGDRIVIDVLGMTSGELPPAFNRIGPSTHASRSYPGFVNWLTAMQPRWHIGLAPLLDTRFNRAKSPLKAMDYAALGLTVLASDTPVYRGSIADGPAGQLVRNDPFSWQAALDWLIRNQALRASRTSQARTAFLSQGTLATQAPLRLDAWRRLLPDRKLEATTALHQKPLTLTMSHDEVEPATRKRRHRH
jgi:glycosyltransferase involved in cell wall biosynthesis